MKVKKEIYVCPKCAREHEGLMVMSFNSGIKPMAESAKQISQQKITKCGKCGVELLTEADYIKELKKHADAGEKKAQHNLGYRYFKGNGLKQDYNEAVKWLTKSAEQGLAEAQSQLGFCYSMGHGVEQDHKKAFELYLKSAEQGLAVAQYNISKSYYEGNGTDKNPEKALEWLKKSAEQGYEKAAEQLKKHKDHFG